MEIINYYYELSDQLDVERLALQIATEKTENLRLHLLGIKSPNFENEGHIQKAGMPDKVIEFLYRTEEEKQANGMTLKEEITYRQANIKTLKKAMKEIEKKAEKLRLSAKFGNKRTKIILALFTRLNFEGKSPTEAVEETAEEFGYTDAGTIWRLYYPDVKKKKG